MKDSGLKGMGAIPKHWKLIPIKYVAALDPPCHNNIAENEEVTFAPMECIRNDRRTPRVALKSGDNGTCSKFNDGDIAIAKVTPCFENGNICIMQNLVNGYAYGSSELYSVRASSINRRFLFYYFQSSCFVDGGTSSMTGVAGLKRVTSNYMRNAKIPLPPKDEQNKIVSYLDSACPQISSFIDDAEKTISEYQQWKASVICQSVTMGLNPDAEKKRCNIEWIGAMPKNWSLIRVKYLLKEVNHRSQNGTEKPLSMSQIYGLVPSEMISVANPAESYVGAKIVQPNDLVFNKLKAHLGVFAVSDYDGLVSPDYAVYQTNSRVLPKFLEYLFKTPRCITEFKKYISGVGAGLSRLYTNDLFNIHVALPPIDEQVRIIDYLQKLGSEIDSIISEKETLIVELESYKKSLIYEAVTGKRKVV